MKKPNKVTRKRAPKKAKQKPRGPAPNPKSKSTALAELLAGMSSEQLAEVLAGDFFGEFEEDDAAGLFEYFLDLSRLNASEGLGDDEELEEVIEVLTAKLVDLRLSMQGGSRDARKEGEAFLALVDDAANDKTLTGRDFMMIAKIMSDAGWPPPESLKRATAASLEDSLASAELESIDPATAGQELTAALLEVLKAAGDDEFEICAALASMLASFPDEVASSFLQVIAENGSAEIDLALVGFVLHPSADIAGAALNALVSKSRPGIDSRVVERLVRVRPWTPEARRETLDAAIRALRPRASAPVAQSPDQVGKVYMTACDGSGARTVIFTARNGGRQDAYAVMIKEQGVAEVSFLEDIGHAGTNGLINDLGTIAEPIKSDLADAQYVLCLGLADNLDFDTPPPYELVRLAERLALGPLIPNAASTVEIVEECLAGATPAQRDRANRLEAHRRVLNHPMAETWFEANEDVEALLEPLRTRKQRVNSLMKEYLPSRRARWARLCAVNALALRGPASRRRPHISSEFALVALDLLDEMPIGNLPFMIAVADMSVTSFEESL